MKLYYNPLTDKVSVLKEHDGCWLIEGWKDLIFTFILSEKYIFYTLIGIITFTSSYFMLRVLYHILMESM